MGAMGAAGAVEFSPAAAREACVAPASSVASANASAAPPAAPAPSASPSSELPTNTTLLKQVMDGIAAQTFGSGGVSVFLLTSFVSSIVAALYYVYGALKQKVSRRTYYSLTVDESAFRPYSALLSFMLEAQKEAGQGTFFVDNDNEVKISARVDPSHRHAQRGDSDDEGESNGAADEDQGGGEGGTKKTHSAKERLLQFFPPPEHLDLSPVHLGRLLPRLLPSLKGAVAWARMSVTKPSGPGQSQGGAQLKLEVYSLLLPPREVVEELFALALDKHEVQRKERDERISVFASSDNGWNHMVVAQRTRELSSVMLPPGTSASLLSDVKKFLDPASRRWYVNKGIPFRRGYLLYGPPGNGKTSFITSLAGHVRCPLFILSLTSKTMDDSSLIRLISHAGQMVGGENAILLLEDVDAAFLGRDPREGCKLSFQGLLNALDGVLSSHTLLFMTTNHIDHLDPALIRPGRVDRRFQFLNAAPEQIEALVMAFFEITGQPKEDLRAKAASFAASVPPHAFSMAQLQGYFLANREAPLDEILRADALNLWLESQNAPAAASAGNGAGGSSAIPHELPRVSAGGSTSSSSTSGSSGGGRADAGSTSGEGNSSPSLSREYAKSAALISASAPSLEAIFQGITKSTGCKDYENYATQLKISGVTSEALAYISPESLPSILEASGISNKVHLAVVQGALLREMQRRGGGAEGENEPIIMGGRTLRKNGAVRNR
jgi:chaperone BCS1